MFKIFSLGLLSILLLSVVSCTKQDEDLRRAELFYKNKKFYEASQAYEKAAANDPKILEDPEIVEKFKNSYYYYGGSLEMSGSLEQAIPYYEKGLALAPKDLAICDKLAKHFWKEEDFEKSAEYFAKLVELDADLADSDQKWINLGEDYYALGYSLYQIEKDPEAKEALEQSLKVSPQGVYAKKAKSALDAIKSQMK